LPSIKILSFARVPFAGGGQTTEFLGNRGVYSDVRRPGQESSPISALISGPASFSERAENPENSRFHAFNQRNVGEPAVCHGIVMPASSL
jgi:hypothetical protein